MTTANVADRVAESTGGIRLSSLRKEFGDRGKSVVAVDDLDLNVSPGEMVALLGPSGCGKSTTLRCIAGLEIPDRGRIDVDGTPVFDSSSKTIVAPERRGVGMMFQSYALWPHMRVFDNVAYPLHSRKMKKDLQARVMSIVETVGCIDLVDRFPSELSGGQQQRVALARALVAEPRVVLFDEPLSNLDARLRDQMRFELLELHVRLGFTGIYVTHDQDEALTIADRVVVMDRGSILQQGGGEEVYRRPDSIAVARFFGEANELTGIVTAKTESDRTANYTVDTWLGNVHIETDKLLERGDEVILGARPEFVEIHPDAGSRQAMWSAKVDHISFLGPNALVFLHMEGHQLTAKVPTSEPLPSVGDFVGVSVQPLDWLVFGGEV